MADDVVPAVVPAVHSVRVRDRVAGALTRLHQSVAHRTVAATVAARVFLDSCRRVKEESGPLACVVRAPNLSAEEMARGLLVRAQPEVEAGTERVEPREPVAAVVGDGVVNDPASARNGTVLTAANTGAVSRFIIGLPTNLPADREREVLIVAPQDQLGQIQQAFDAEAETYGRIDDVVRAMGGRFTRADITREMARARLDLEHGSTETLEDGSRVLARLTNAEAALLLTQVAQRLRAQGATADADRLSEAVSAVFVAQAGVDVQQLHPGRVVTTDMVIAHIERSARPIREAVLDGSAPERIRALGIPGTDQVASMVREHVESGRVRFEAAVAGRGNNLVGELMPVPVAVALLEHERDQRRVEQMRADAQDSWRHLEHAQDFDIRTRSSVQRTKVLHDRDIAHAVSRQIQTRTGEPLSFTIPTYSV